MTQDSNRDAFSPWGEPTVSAPVAWWAPLVTLPALMGHIVVMLSAMAALTVINLIANPGTWWSLAILVIWVTLVIIHALGVASLRFLLDEDDQEAAPTPHIQAEPHGPEMPAEIDMMINERTGPPAPKSWERAAEDGTVRSWPQASEPNGQKPQAPVEDTPSANGASERVPWRAATDIAWLRRPRPDDADKDQSGSSEEASS